MPTKKTTTVPPEKLVDYEKLIATNPRVELILMALSGFDCHLIKLNLSSRSIKLNWWRHTELCERNM